MSGLSKQERFNMIQQAKEARESDVQFGADPLASVWSFAKDPGQLGARGLADQLAERQAQAIKASGVQFEEDPLASVWWLTEDPDQPGAPKQWSPRSLVSEAALEGCPTPSPNFRHK